MKLSTRSTYGVRAMLALAERGSTRPVMSKEIAELQGLPATYLEQLMVLLRKANLLTATRGAHGGYVLARPASEITLLDIIEVLEGSLTLSDCPAGQACCGHPETCALQDVWEEAGQALRDALRNITLANLVERQRDKTADPVLMYSI